MRNNYEYTSAQAESLLTYFRVWIPGSLEAAETALKRADLWPEDEEDE